MHGVNAPKVVECMGSDGRVYKQLAKSGNDDLRQDAAGVAASLPTVPLSPPSLSPHCRSLPTQSPTFPLPTSPSPGDGAAVRAGEIPPSIHPRPLPTPHLSHLSPPLPTAPHQVMEQLFGLVNSLLQAHEGATRRHLAIRTYKVTPSLCASCMALVHSSPQCQCMQAHAGATTHHSSPSAPSLCHLLPPSAICSLPLPSAPSLCHLLPPSAICSLPLPSAPSLCHLLPPSAICSLPPPSASSLCHLLPPSAICSLPPPSAPSLRHLLPPSAICSLPLPPAPSLCHLLPPSAICSLPLPSAPSLCHLLPPFTVCIIPLHLLPPSAPTCPSLCHLPRPPSPLHGLSGGALHSQRS
ncbi:unnamed protein product [Closterium sp. Yama58-4]|nr:unnamed protein product [Closterium sp. Yama58-4]